jgi:myo-inositol-hexaphosphate 3-phosphohydrolase
MSRLLSTLLFSALLPVACGALAGESATLSDGHRLQLDKQALRLLDARGAELARLPLRAKHLDARSRKNGALAVVFDTDRQMPLLLRVSEHDIAVERSLPPVSFPLEELCLYRDAQRLDHLFLIAKDGQAEQWLLGNAQSEPRLFRHLALPPEAKNCHADDARHLLYVEEKGIGVWAYAADGEGIPRRKLLRQIPRSASIKAAARKDAPAIVVASAQTGSVARSGDAADDPAIWVHPGDAAQSLVIATNKKQGLLSYDLKGEQKQLIEAGRLNNVDVRQNLNLGGKPVDLAVATQRDENALAVFEIAADGSMRDAGRIATDLAEIYGTCLYRTPQGELNVFANDKDGRFEQYRITRSGEGYAGKLVRSFRVATQPEGCVADDRNGRLFIGEEDRGIWTVSASASGKDKPQLILATGKLLVADVEGLALYHGKSSTYLIASSQGNSSYVVLDAAPPYKVRGAFRIGINAEAGIDGTSDTDGIEASAVNFGGVYGDGMLVAQDGYKRLPDGAQNFKYVPWRDIARALKLDSE